MNHWEVPEHMKVALWEPVAMQSHMRTQSVMLGTRVVRSGCHLDIWDTATETRHHQGHTAGESPWQCKSSHTLICMTTQSSHTLIKITMLAQNSHILIRITMTTQNSHTLIRITMMTQNSHTTQDNHCCLLTAPYYPSLIVCLRKRRYQWSMVIMIGTCPFSRGLHTFAMLSVEVCDSKALERCPADHTPHTPYGIGYWPSYQTIFIP